MNLDIGSNVLSSDGHRVGKVDRIIFESDSMSVREFVVHKGMLFLSRDRFVDRELVDHIGDEHTVHLSVTAEEAKDLPEFFFEQHTPIIAGDSHHAEQVHIQTIPGSVPRDAVVLSHRSEVYDSEDKHIGHLDEVVYEQDGVATAFIVDAGRIFTHDVRVPVSAIHSITHDRIRLNITAEEAEEAARG